MGQSIWERPSPLVLRIGKSISLHDPEEVACVECFSQLRAKAFLYACYVVEVFSSSADGSNGEYDREAMQSSFTWCDSCATFQGCRCIRYSFFCASECVLSCHTPFALTFHLLGVLRVVAATCLPLAFKSLVEVRVFCLYSVAPNFKAAALLYRIPA